jgi:hypothetical protein
MWIMYWEIENYWCFKNQGEVEGRWVALVDRWFR